MIKQIRDDAFNFANKYNKTCNVVVGLETFKEIQNEAHPERLKPWTFEGYEEKGYKPTIVGCNILKGNFDYGYYIIED